MHGCVVCQQRWPPLFRAVSMPSVGLHVVSVLIKAGADCTQVLTNASSPTVLLAAFAHRRLDLFEALLEGGAMATLTVKPQWAKHGLLDPEFFSTMDKLERVRLSPLADMMRKMDGRMRQHLNGPRARVTRASRRISVPLAQRAFMTAVARHVAKLSAIVAHSLALCVCRRVIPIVEAYLIESCLSKVCDWSTT